MLFVLFTGVAAVLSWAEHQVMNGWDVLQNENITRVVIRHDTCESANRCDAPWSRWTSSWYSHNEWMETVIHVFFCSFSGNSVKNCDTFGWKPSWCFKTYLWHFCTAISCSSYFFTGWHINRCWYLQWANIHFSVRLSSESQRSCVSWPPDHIWEY